jgi:hypothetical protein
MRTKILTPELLRKLAERESEIAAGRTLEIEDAKQLNEMIRKSAQDRERSAA